MDHNLQKTILFLAFILLGLLLKVKLKNKQELAGIKMIILNLALPATIFIALLSIDVELSLLILPFMALALNVVLFALAPAILSFTGLKRGTANFRTAHLLIPSLAPGLSCFPFILEYLGESYLAKAAMADLGNKVFVLLVLYLIAMRWHYKTQEVKGTSNSSKLKNLMLAMVTEPVNLFIAGALILLFAGFRLDTLPFVFSEGLLKLSLLMTPLVLLFIGLSVSVKRNQFLQILSLLLIRAGIVILFALAVCYLGNISIAQDRLLLLAFGLSACSFWPFAHIAAVASQEKELNNLRKTFNQNYAINILAISFPLSVLLILGILATGTQFASLSSLLVLALSLVLSGSAYPIARYFYRKRKYSNSDIEITASKKPAIQIRQIHEN
ncbi:AEC family transporter [Leeuwenhoekiella nanhaiensis]|uniref:permease n=1 Tax=Leeuwenhoekiella nanhaiensis TaxID=1655491 RepID=UPI00167177A4|nr:permease [Leeuwenhoekiella nanhaiensis]